MSSSLAQGASCDRINAAKIQVDEMHDWISKYNTS
jgi:hypothetical protein